MRTLSMILMGGLLTIFSEKNRISNTKNINLKRCYYLCKQKIIILISLAFLLTSCATFKHKKQGFVSNQEYFKEIPFDYENGFIFIPVTIEGKEYNFFLDTGAELNLIDPSITSELSLKKLKKGTIRNGKDSERKVERVEIETISIGGIDFHETVGMIWDISKFSKYISCRKIDGFIGNNLMRKSNWQIDYQNQVIRLSDISQKFRISSESKKIKMNADVVGNVHLNLKIGEKHKDFTFDTGYSGFIQTGDTTLLNTAPSIIKRGVTGANFNGTKEGTTYYKKLETFDIGEYTFKCPSYFLIKPGNTSVLGNKFFENYTLTIDWDNDTLFLDENSEINFTEPNMYEIGFFTDYDKGIITIANIYEKSSLIDKIRPKSKVVKINNINLIEFEQSGKLCEFWSKNWGTISKSKSLKIVIEYDGVQQEVEVNKIKNSL